MKECFGQYNTKYFITYDDNGKQKESGNFPRPERLPKTNDIFVFQTLLWTIGGHEYGQGDELKILKRTNKAPHKRLSSLGNLLVRSKYGDSIWTCIEALIAEGHLKLK